MTGAERIFDAITDVRGDYVDAAGDYRFARRHPAVPAAWRQYAALAACLVLIVGGAFALSRVRMGGSGGDAGGGWTSGSANGGSDNGGDGSDWNGAPPPGTAGGSEPGDGAPPPLGGTVEGDPPSGEEAPRGVTALRAEGETESVSVLRELTLTFREDGTVLAEDRYVLTNTGTEDVTVTLRWGAAALVSCSRNAEILEDNAYRVAIPDGCTAELVLESVAVPADGVLTVEEPQGFAALESTVSIVNRQWMEERGVTVMLGDTVLDP